MNCTGAMEYKNIKLLKNWLAITDGNTTFEVKKGIDTVTGKRGFQMEIVAEFKSQNFATVPPNHLEISELLRRLPQKYDPTGWWCIYKLPRPFAQRDD